MINQNEFYQTKHYDGGDIKYIIKIWNYCDCVEVSGYPYYKKYNITNMTTSSKKVQRGSYWYPVSVEPEIFYPYPYSYTLRCTDSGKP